MKRSTWNGWHAVAGTVNEVTADSVNVTWDHKSSIQWTSHFGPGCDIESELTRLSPVEELARVQIS